MTSTRSPLFVQLATVALVAGAALACSGDDGHDPARVGAADSQPVDAEAAGAETADAPDASRGRLLVRVTIEGDNGSEQRTEVIDLDDGSVVGSLETGARIYPDPDGRIGIVDESWTHGRLRFVDPGIDIIDGEVSKRPPMLLEAEVPSEEVLNVDIGSRFVGVFSESGSIARFIDTSPLPVDDAFVVTIDDNGGLSMIDEEGMGGQALPWGDEFLVSIVSEGDPPFAAGPMPVGIRRFDAAGEAIEDFTCAGLGFAAAEDIAVLACSDGLLVLERQGTEVVTSTVAYPSETVSCFQVIGGPDIPAFLVLCSDANTFEFLDLYRFSLTDRELTTLDGTAGRWTTHLVGSGDDAQVVYLERATGDVVVHGLLDGAELGRTSAVVAPFPAFPVSWSMVSGDRFYVGFVAANADDDEAADAVIEIDLASDTPRVTRTFPLPGTPGRLEVLGAVSN